METLSIDIIVYNILQLVFPFNSVLFLTSKFFNNLQESYYGLLGCTDVASKNFMHKIMNLNTKKELEITKNLQWTINYNFDMVPFANKSLTLLMDKYFELFIDFAQLQKHSKNEIKKQILMSVSQKTCGTGSVCTTIIEQLLAHKNNTSYKLQVNKYLKRSESPTFIKRMISHAVSTVNLFYSMIGVKRAYKLEWKRVYCGYCRCAGVYLYGDDHELDIENKCYCYENYDYDYDDFMDDDMPDPHEHDDAYEFIIHPKTNYGPGKYFYCPNWYNKIYRVRI